MKFLLNLSLQKSVIVFYPFNTKKLYCRFFGHPNEVEECDEKQCNKYGKQLSVQSCSVQRGLPLFLQLTENKYWKCALFICALLMDTGKH